MYLRYLAKQVAGASLCALGLMRLPLAHCETLCGRPGVCPRSVSSQHVGQYCSPVTVTEIGMIRQAGLYDYFEIKLKVELNHAQT